MGAPRGIAKILDDEKLFWMYYRDLAPGGSIPKIHGWLASKGIRVTTSAVWQSIMRHLARNYDEHKVKAAFKSYYIHYGKSLTDEEYYWIVSKHTRTCFAKKQYANWLTENPKIPDLREEKDK